MPRGCNIRIFPGDLSDETKIQHQISRALRMRESEIGSWKIVRRSIDARKALPVFVLRLEVYEVGEIPETESPFPEFPNVSQSPEVHIVGAGPAGLFAALTLMQQGLKPVILDRGKEVRERRRDLVEITRNGIVNPNSNYCFGEGGAGTFSDGKLYTRAKKRGNTTQILNTLVHFGATPEILIDAHPHIGTNKLPQIIENIRECVLAHGGEIHFNSSLTHVTVQTGALTHIEVNGQETLPVNRLILATGHSARDIYRLLHRTGIAIEAKPFAVGVRIEHPQALIDQIQYHCEGARHENLPAAAYSWVQQANGRGVYSFCMCPGGIICPAATQNEEVVVNGWSPSKRNSPYANSGIVVEVGALDFGDADVLAGMEWQAKIEQKAYQVGGGAQKAPAQRVMDFLKDRYSRSLPNSSYLPGMTSARMSEVLPAEIYQALQQGLRQIGRRMKGYLTQEAVVLGVESRTSAPVKIPREKETCMHPQVEGLYPCGEGAGYAGGIMSAALDGQRVARAISLALNGVIS